MKKFNFLILCVLTTALCSGLSAFTSEASSACVTASCKDATLSLDGTGCVDITTLSINNGSSATGNIVSMTLDRTRFCCEDVLAGPQTVTLTIAASCVDPVTGISCSEIATCQSTVTVQDEFAPIIFCPEDKTLTLQPGQCGSFNTQPTPLVIDNCGATITGSGDPGFVSVACNTDCNGPASGTATTYSYIAVDESGNESTCEFTVTLQDYTPFSGSLSCNDQVNLSANLDCDFELTPQMLLQGDYGCYSCFDVTTEEIHTTSALAEFRMTITDPCTGVSCWGFVTVEDKNDPTLACSGCTDPNVTDPDCILNCVELPLFTTLNRENGVLGYDENLLDDLIPTDREDFVAEFVTESCGQPVTANFSDQVTSSNNCGDGALLTRTWTIQFTRANGSLGSLSCERYYRFDDIQPLTVNDAEGNIAGVEAPHDTIAPGLYVPFVENDIDAGVIVEDVILMPKQIVEIPSCGVGVSPAEIAAYFDNPLTEDQDTDDDNIDPDEFDVDCVIENNEGIWFAYPHYYIQGIRPDGPHAQPITDRVCNQVVDYVDTPIEACAPGCEGNQRLLRVWTVLDWCTNQFFEYNQVIKVEDQIAPTMEVPTIVASVDPWDCEATINLPAPTKLNDACDDNLTYSIGFVEGALDVTGNADDGFVIHGVKAGETLVQYIAEDCCGNQSKVFTTISVSDITPPIPVTKQNLVVELTSFGTPGQGVAGIAKLYAEDIDNDSYDSCTKVFVDIRRTPVCDKEDAEWGPFVSFCCEDLAGASSTVIDVEMRVRDLFGNESFIWSSVTLQDKAGGTGSCPLDVVIKCTDDIWNFDVTGGTPRSFTTCQEVTQAVDTLQVFENTEPSRKNANDGGPSLGQYFGVRVEAYDPSCGFGAWEREFDGCTQWIVVEPEGGVTIDDEGRFVIPSGFDDSTLQFPDDVEVDCDAYDTGEPTWLESSCNLVGFTVESEEFNFEGDACLKIVNTYTVIDWCAYDPTDPDLNNIVDLPAAGENFDRFIHDSGEVEGRYIHNQIIKVIDTEAPVISTDDVAFDANLECSSKGLTISAIGLDNGECSSAWLSWEIELDFFGDWTIDATYSSRVSAVLPSGDPNPSYVPKTNNGSAITIAIPEGIGASNAQHRIEWNVNDGCGNTTSHTSYFTIRDNKAPTPMCLNLGTAVMENGEVELWAIDFNNKSFDNCSGEELLFTFTDVAPPSRCDAEYDSNSQLLWYNGTFWYYDSSQVEDDVQECGVTGAGEYQNIEDYGGDVHRWEPGTQSAGKIFTIEEFDNGFLDVPIYVWDAEGNKDFCLVRLRAEDNDGGLSAGVVAGTVRTETAQTIEGVEANLMSNNPSYPRTDMTEQDGRFEFVENEMSRDYLVSGLKDGDDANGVSTIDLVKIQRHILDIEKLDSPYKMIAADVNGDKRINGQDLVELRKLILGIYVELPQSESWMILNAEKQLDTDNPWDYDLTRNIQNLSLDLMQEDFIGVKIGDVDNDVNVNQAASTDTNGKVLNLSAPMGMVQAGEEISITLSTDQKVSGYQFTLETGDMELVDVSGISEDKLAVHKDAITVSENLTEQKVGELITITLRANHSGAVEDMIGLSSRITKAEAYVGPTLEKVDLSLSGASQGDFSLRQNEPNPFSAETTIHYTLPEASAVTVILMDVTGQIINTIDTDGNAGANALKLDRTGLSTGLIYYRLQAGNNVATRHMIVIE